MYAFIFICVAVVFIFFKLPFFLLTNTHNILFYSVKDILKYIFKHDKKFNYYGIDMFIGMFGKGKTLSMVHQARSIYKSFGDDVLFLSNISLENIPYIPLTNFNQLLELPEGYKGYVVIIDEVSSVLSHRNYANFPLELLNTLTQQRKQHIYIMSTSQRYFMCDKIFRSITTNVIDCSKFWRFEHCKVYDAWDYENAGILIPRQLNHYYWFIKDIDFNSYDTSEMIDKNKTADFISNDEAIKRKCLDNNIVNMQSHKDKKRVRKLG